MQNKYLLFRVERYELANRTEKPSPIFVVVVVRLYSFDLSEFLNETQKKFQNIQQRTGRVVL